MALPHDQSGVASAVGTILSVLVVVIFLSAAFAIQDVQNATRERTLILEAEEAMGRVRQAHDIQYNAMSIPISVPGTTPRVALTVPIPLGLPGEGPFVPPVLGRLTCVPGDTVARLSFSYRIPGGALDAVERSSGVLALELFTVKVPRAKLLWENGAVLLVQSDGAHVLDYPYFSVDVNADGVDVTYRALRVVGDLWSLDGNGVETVSVQTLTIESYPLTVFPARGDANLDDVRDFVRSLKDEIRAVSTDGSGRLTGSYADDPPSEGILNQGLTEQLVYYDNAERKQQIPDCEGASNDMNASARQLLDNVMDKILEGIDTGYIDEDYGLDLHARMAALLRCLDEMSGSLRDDCTFKCASLFGGGGGGSLEFLITSEHRDAWHRWFEKYLDDRSVPAEDWTIEARGNFILVRIDRVGQLNFEAAYVKVVPPG